MEKAEYYAIIGVGRTRDNPSGIVCRKNSAGNRVDESLRRDLSWGPTSAITDWEYGNLSGELVEISAEEAEALVERFRERWGGA